jgi:hypothetical protein
MVVLEISLSVISLDGKVSTDGIRHDLGMSRARHVALILTSVSSFSSPNVERNKQDETFAVYPLQFVAGSNDVLQVNNYDGRFNTGSLPLTRR